MARFINKVVLVTGAASGLGAATVLRLVSEGAQVFATGRNQDGLQVTQTQANKSSLHGGRMEIAILDVSQPQSCTDSVKDCVKKFGHLDALINVAGGHVFRHTTDITEAEWLQDLAVNLNGPFFLSKAAIPYLLESKGNIVNVASIAGMQGQAYSAGYCSAKHGLIGLTKALAIEYMNTPLRVNAVVPGGMKTSQVEKIKFPKDVDFNLIMRTAAVRGFMPVEDVAAMIAFIASDEARSIHGSVQVVDAGRLAG